MSAEYERQTEIANTIVNGVVHQLAMAMNAFHEPGHKVALSASIAAVGTGAMAAAMAKQVPQGTKYVPNPDDTLFACLMLANSTTYGPDGVMAVEFAFTDVIKTLEDFERLTNRSYEPEMNDSLLGIVNEERAKAQSAFQGEMSQFGPN